jgi:hypothetical protein
MLRAGRKPGSSGETRPARQRTACPNDLSGGDGAAAGRVGGIRLLQSDMVESEERTPHQIHRRLARIVAAGLSAALLMPPLGAALWGLGLPVAPAVAVAAVIAAGTWIAVAARLPESLEGRARERWWLSALWLVVMGAVVVRVATLSVFMVDPARVQFSMLPELPDVANHSCLSAYTEADRLAAERRHNIYAPEMYEDRSIGTISVDRYEYPPPFLLFPRALRMVAADFFHARALMFGFQVVLLVAAIIALAVWIGGAGSGWARCCPWSSPSCPARRRS